jgi:hypothetical protein
MGGCELSSYPSRQDDALAVTFEQDLKSDRQPELRQTALNTSASPDFPGMRMPGCRPSDRHLVISPAGAWPHRARVDQDVRGWENTAITRRPGWSLGSRLTRSRRTGAEPRENRDAKIRPYLHPVQRAVANASRRAIGADQKRILPVGAINAERTRR